MEISLKFTFKEENLIGNNSSRKNCKNDLGSPYITYINVINYIQHPFNISKLTVTCNTLQRLILKSTSTA